MISSAFSHSLLCTAWIYCDCVCVCVVVVVIRFGHSSAFCLIACSLDQYLQWMSVCVCVCVDEFITITTITITITSSTLLWEHICVRSWARMRLRWWHLALLALTTKLANRTLPVVPFDVCLSVSVCVCKCTEHKTCQLPFSSALSLSLSLPLLVLSPQSVAVATLRLFPHSGRR